MNYEITAPYTVTPAGDIRVNAEAIERTLQAARDDRERDAAAFVRRRTLRPPRFWTNPIPRTGRGAMPNRRPA